jgi:hypothetical protein
MCTVLLPPGGYPIAVKYIISYISYQYITILEEAKKSSKTGSSSLNKYICAKFLHVS